MHVFNSKTCKIFFKKKLYFQELYLHYISAINKENHSVEPITEQSSVFNSLQKALIKQPLQIHILLSQLIDTDESPSNQVPFYHVYIKCMQYLLESISCNTSKNEEGDKKNESLYSETNQLAATFVDILCLFNLPSQYFEPVKESLESLFYSLTEVIEKRASPVITIESLYCALLGRDNTDLVKLFHAVQSRWKRQFSLLKCSISPGVDFTSEHCHVMGLAYLTDRQDAWKQLLFISLQTQKHFLDIVMVSN